MLIFVYESRICLFFIFAIILICCLPFKILCKCKSWYLNLGDKSGGTQTEREEHPVTSTPVPSQEDVPSGVNFFSLFQLLLVCK